MSKYVAIYESASNDDAIYLDIGAGSVEEATVIALDSADTGFYLSRLIDKNGSVVWRID